MGLSISRSELWLEPTSQSAEIKWSNLKLADIGLNCLNSFHIYSAYVFFYTNIPSITWTTTQRTTPDVHVNQILGKDLKRVSMPEPVNHQVNAARKTFQTLHQISKLLNTNLDPLTLSICVRLCENGVNPQALATVVKELQREVKVLGNMQSDSAPSKTSLTK